MSINTGENEQGLRKIIDMARMISIIILLLHFYYYCYNAFAEWQLTTTVTDRLLQNIFATGLLSNFSKSKLIALGFLSISLPYRLHNKIGNRDKIIPMRMFSPYLFNVYTQSNFVLQ